MTLQAYSFVRQSSHAHREARGPVESNHAEPHTSGDPLVLMKHLWPRRGRARGGASLPAPLPRRTCQPLGKLKRSLKTKQPTKIT